MFEKIIAKQLTSYLDTYSGLSTSQFGFRRGLSTKAALLRLSKLLFTAQQHSQFSAVTTIDFSKVFECVNHSILLKVLRAVGLSNSAVLWFKSYLSGRLQRVRYGGVLSKPLNVLHGVLEGSILGPHLFKIYIDSLLRSLPADSVEAYVDDLTLVSHSALPVECTSNILVECTSNMQGLLNIVNSRSCTSLMAANSSKCFTMFISSYICKRTDNISQCITLENNTLAIVAKLRIIGMDFSNDLSWVAHSNTVRKKINGMLGVLKICGRTMNTNVRRQIFNSFIVLRLDFCLPMWGHLPKTSSDLMDYFLLRALRYIVYDPKACFTGETCNLLGLRKFRQATDVRCLVRIFSAIQRGTLGDIIYLDDCAVSTSQTLTRSTGANKICSFIPKRRADDYCFQVAAPMSWNKLPNNITSAASKKTLISKIDSLYNSQF